jgi:hypothetical protein
MYIAACPAFFYPELNYHCNRHRTFNFRGFEFDLTNHFNRRRLHPSTMAANLSSAFGDLSLDPSKGRQIEDSNMDVDDMADTNPSLNNKSNPTEQPAQATGDLESHLTDAVSVRAFALVQADRYLASFPGWSNAANNTTLHNGLRRLHDHNEHMSMFEIERILGQSKFRLDLADRAFWLLEAADIPFPERLRCDEFNERAFMMCELRNP